MHRIFITLICCVTLNLTLWGQLAGTPPHGAISIGLSGISSIDTGDWAVFNNPAALVHLSKRSVSVGYQTSLNFSPFNSSLAAINLPTHWGVGAIAVSRFGDELFSSQIIALGFAHRVGEMDLGLKLNLAQISIDGFGKRSIPIFELGGLIDLSPQLTLGTHIYNFTQALLAREIQEKAPVILRLSLDYHPDEDLNIYIEVAKDIHLRPELRFALAYRLIEKLTIRTGISPVEGGHSFGFGLTFKHFILNYALSRVRVNVRHSFGLTCHFNDK